MLWVKAMVTKESNFKRKAESPVGARGLLQVMPATWYNVRGARWKCKLDGFDVELNIKKGVNEFKRNYKVFRAPQGVDRYRIVTAAYNAGTRHIISAQLLAEKAGGSERIWADVAPHLIKVTLQRSIETLNHIVRVEAAFIEMGGKLEELEASA